MIDTTDVVPSEGRIKLGRADSTPDAPTRKSTNTERDGLHDALTLIDLLHKQAKSHGIPLRNTKQEYRDVYAKYGQGGAS